VKKGEKNCKESGVAIAKVEWRRFNELTGVERTLLPRPGKEEGIWI